MKHYQQPSPGFPKPIQAPPTEPIRKLLKNLIVDANNTVYNVWDHNGEKVYTVKFHLFVMK